MVDFWGGPNSDELERAAERMMRWCQKHGLRAAAADLEAALGGPDAALAGAINRGPATAGDNPLADLGADEPTAALRARALLGVFRRAIGSRAAEWLVIDNAGVVFYAAANRDGGAE